MIAMLTGNVVEKTVEHLIVDVAGVGYRVMVPLSTFYRLPEEGAVSLRIFTSVKEDSFQLFGFGTQEEKELFIKLLSISGVGPKLALNILSNIDAEELRSALFHGDVKKLSSVPGIGKKTAERLVLELKDKVGQPSASSTTTTAFIAKSAPLDDALSALINLGYKESMAQKALQLIDPSVANNVEDILKQALKVLVK